jgi:outer membrane murein-binding lipoprotein Lpp
MTNRDDYVKKMHAKLDQWNADIDRLEAKMKAASADVQVVYQRKLDQLRAQRDEAASRLQRLRESSGAAWEELRAGMELAWGALSEALQSAKSQFK